MKGLYLIGRVLLGGYFLFSGSHHFTDLSMMTNGAAAKGVPIPQLAVIGAGILLIVGGLSLILGLAPKLGIAALVLFMVPVTLMMHQFWNTTGPAHAAQMINFTKNVGLTGAILMLLALPEPWPFSVANMVVLPRWRKLHPVTQ